MTAVKTIYEHIDRGVLTIWLDRPEAKNGMDPPMLEAFAASLSRAASRDEAKIIVIRGANGTFCTGADLGDMEDPVLDTSVGSIMLVQQVATIFRRLFDIGKPTIAAVEGWAVAGGFEIAISCDFALAAANARIGDFHIRRSLFGGAGPIYRLPRLIGLRRAKELVLTGKILSGSKAAEWGIVNAVSDPEDFDGLIARFLEGLSGHSAFCMQLTKMALNHALDADSRTLEVMGIMTQSAVMMSADAREGVSAFLEKREPRWVHR
jgi:enoyl-CoA hydratase/carnithine racemase